MLGRLGKLNELALFLDRISAAEGLTVYPTSPQEEREAIAVMERFSLDFDTAGEVSSCYAAAASAINRANGVMRVLARAISSNHSPSRSTFSPTAVRRCPRRTRVRPL